VKPDGCGNREPDPEGTAAGPLALRVQHVVNGQGVDRPPGDGWVRRPSRTQAAFEGGQPRCARGEAGAEQRNQADRLADAPLALLEGLDRLLDDFEGVFEDVGEQEREHPDREHRERHPPAVAHALEPPDG
jgi:hypothetical protein